jgi:hypothetical protein
LVASKRDMSGEANGRVAKKDLGGQANRMVPKKILVAKPIYGG